MEKFLNILDCKDSVNTRKLMTQWILRAETSGLEPFEKCAETMRNWVSGIMNSFDSTITNGFTEGYNNKIKGLKRNAYGYRNFKRFRNRILHMFSHKYIKKQAAS